MFTLLILADDLTGALDTGVQFAKKGRATRVLLSPAFLAGQAENTAGSVAVLVINTDTRHCSPGDAGKIITACLEQYRDVPYVYKKTDSTLRGHIGAELEALMRARDISQLPFVPAYPGLGRTTAGGHQLLRGVPIDRTDMAADALNPIRHSFIPDIIGEESDTPVRLVPAKGAATNSGSSKGEMLVYDGGTAGELRDIAGSLKKQGLLSVTAGCAGFAEFLMEEIPFPARPAQAKIDNDAIPMLPILILSGSRHPVSLDQVRTALAGGLPGIAVDGEKLRRREWFNGEEAAALEDDCAEALKRQGVCILGTAVALGQIAGGADAAGTAGVAGLLGKLLEKILTKTGPLHLVVFGGDTLLGIMKILKFDYIIPIKEIRPGIVLARAEGRGGSSFIVTKSGAFGGPGMIETIRGELRLMCRAFLEE
ncbi:Hrp-dependent type III effector protein [Spirochaetia bacterium]|nr:Hrp-dependent type III effector protein [Spirochaetia bacterium]